MLPETSARRLAAGKTTAGQPAAKASPAGPASHLTASFNSLLASNSAAKRPAAATPTDKRPTAGATSAKSSGATVSTSGASGASASTTAASGLSDFELLFGGSSYNPADPIVAAAAPPASSSVAANAPPTAQSVFGPDVWVGDPTGRNPDGSSFGYNPIYFATESTAQTVAQMVGGTVITDDVFTKPGNAFVQQQPNYMVQMPSGAIINPGLVASFYTFGFPQSQIDTMIAQEVANTPPPVQTS
jgi:hypothetical protein